MAICLGLAMDRFLLFELMSATRNLKYSATIFFMFSIETSLSCLASRSSRASLADSRVAGRPVKRVCATIRFNAPSKSRTFDLKRSPIRKATLSCNSMFSIAALLFRMATRVSNSGGSIATVKPQPKRDFNRSSTPETSFG